MGTLHPAVKPKTTAALMRAAANPIRVRAFSIVAERVASAKEIADQLGLRDVSLVHHHLKILKEVGLIELVETKKRRGATEHFYRSVQRPLVSEGEWKEFSPEERQNFTSLAIHLIFMDIAQSLEAGILDRRDDRHLTRTPLQVDQEGWRELVQIHSKAFHQSLQVQARSDERRSRSEETAMSVYSVQMLIEGAGQYRK